MDWKTVGEALAKLGLPILGAALPIPGGAAIGAALSAVLGSKDSTPDEVLASITGSSEALQKAKEFELTHQETLLKIQVEAETAQIEAINRSIQAEAASNHWPTYSWRPFIGFMFGLYIFSFVLLPLFHLAPVVLSSDLTMAVGAILGIASWYRGKMQADPTKITDNRG